MITIALASALAVLCVALVLGRAAATASVPHTCSATDRQFLATAHSNIAQLGFWSDQLTHGWAQPADVASQVLSEAQQVAATAPTDPTLKGVRILVDGVLQEYGNAILAKAHGKPGDAHMRRSWQLAAEVQVLLSAARQPLSALGCDVSPLIG